MRRRRNTNRRSRSILLSMALTFVVAQAGAGLLFDHVWPEVRFPLLYRRLDTLEANANPPAVVSLGSSRFGTSLIEEDMTRVLRERSAAADVYAFNAAVPAGDPISSEYVLRRLLQRGIRPRVLLIEILPEALNQPSGWMKSHVERHLGWSELPTHLPEIIRAGELQDYCLGRLFPIYAYRQGFWTFLVDKVRRPAKRDQAATWTRALGDIPTLAADEKARLTRAGLELVRQHLDAYEPTGQAVDALIRILALCQAERIEPILILAPVSSQHRSLYTPQIEQAFQRKLQELCLHFSCTCLDCRDQIPDEEFYDNHHASRQGGRTFTEWLLRRVGL